MPVQLVAGRQPAVLAAVERDRVIPGERPSAAIYSARIVRLER